MVVLLLTDQLEFTWNSSVQTEDVVWKTGQERWMIGTHWERGGAARLDDDDDIYDRKGRLKGSLTDQDILLELDLMGYIFYIE